MAWKRFLLATFALGISLAALAPSSASAQRVVQLTFTPTARAQYAVWIEDPSGTYLQTLGITQAVSYRGIGNRPGAAEMPSGFRWPYGRREGVLPVWAHRRASAPGAELFPRVIFQNRSSEGAASRTSSDFSRDDYFCLSFNQSTTTREALDAVSCASVFNSDKGRYITTADVTHGYQEPISSAPGTYALDMFSLYPPRRDVTACAPSATCFDTQDVNRFATDARRIMPEIDAVTMATQRGGSPVTIMFTVPDEWPDGTYAIYVEVNVEGDYNSSFPAQHMPTGGAWDYWAQSYGYPYLGQPSVVWRSDVRLDGTGDSVSVDMPAGYGSVLGRGATGGDMHAMDGAITNDPTGSPGSGVDRLQMSSGARVATTVIPPAMCERNTPPTAITDLVISQYADRRHAHEFATMSFTAPSDDQRVTRYEARFAQSAITDLASFMRAQPAMAASIDSEALEIPTTAHAGETITVDIGGMTFQTHYWIAVRAIDGCNTTGPIAVVEYTTPNIQFTTVSPCFVATAAYGTPMAHEIGALRRFRDRYLLGNAVGEALVSTYYTYGPGLADFVRQDEDRRAAARTMLAPVVALASWLTD